MKTTVLALLFAASVLGQTYTISTFAGGGLLNNVPASSAIGPVSAVASDAAGNLYFPSTAVILRMDAVTRILTVVAGTGFAGFSGDGGPATAAQVSHPSAIAVDTAGNVYFAEGNRIREISGGVIATIAGNGTAGTTGDNGPATAAQVNPLSLAVDSAGNLYFVNAVQATLVGTTPGGPLSVNSDSIRKISKGVITTIAGNGTCCTLSVDGVPAATPLYNLAGLAIDAAGNIYTASNVGPDNPGGIRELSNGVLNTVATGLFGISGLVVDSTGTLYATQARYPSPGAFYKIANGTTTTLLGADDSGPLGDPAGLSIDGSGNVYIADDLTDTISEYTSRGLATVAGNGSAGYYGDGGPATSAQLLSPQGLATDTAGNLYIPDFSSHVREVSNGIINTVAGSRFFGFGGDGGPATAANLYNPTSVAVDSGGNLYIADTANQCVRKVSNGVITTFAGRGSGINGFGDGGPATAAFFASVSGIAVDSAGNVYVSDSAAGRVRRISNGIITTVAGNGNRGFSGDGGLATSALLWQPADLAVDSAGNLYINDTANRRIRKVSNGVITTFAGTGSATSSGDGGPATSAGLGGVGGLAVDSAGNVYLSDRGHIREISNGIVASIAGTGQAGYSGENIDALQAPINPGALAVDLAGNIYFSEPGANRVRVLRPSTANCPGLVSPASMTVSNAGGNFTFNVVENTGCFWTVQGLPSWISYSGTGGAGQAVIALVVASNTGAARAATFTISGVPIMVTQESLLSIATTSPLPVAAVGAAYSQTLSAASGLPPYAWSMSSGALPSGVTLSGVGVVSGTPVAAGVYNFTVLVTDAASASTSAALNLTVLAPGGAIPPGSIVTHTIPGPSQHVFLDAAGNVYAAGDSSGAAPVSPGAAQPQSNGAHNCGIGNTIVCPNAYFTKYDRNGNLQVGTFFGGATTTTGNGITADAAGNIYVVGAGAVPVSANAAIPTAPPGGSAFAAKLSADGTKFLYATYLLAAVYEIPGILVVDAAGNLYIAAMTSDHYAFVIKLSADGSTILYSTKLALNATIAAFTFDPNGNLLVAGTASGNLPITSGALQPKPSGTSDAYIVRLDPAGNIRLATYLGGSGVDSVSAVQTDSAGNIYVAGATFSTDFPTTADAPWPAPPIPLWSSVGSQFGFVAKLSSDGASLLYSTYMMSLSGVAGFTVSANGEAYAAGATLSGFPVTASAPLPCFSGTEDLFLAHLGSDGALLDATYAPGHIVSAMAVASDGSVYLAQIGTLEQVRFGDASFVAPACITPTLLNAANQIAGAGVVPGEFVTLVGSGIGPQIGVAYQPAPEVPIPTSTGGVQVFFDGVPAPVLYAQSRQVNAQVPYGVTGTTVVTLKYNGTVFGPISTPVTFAEPEILRREEGISTEAFAFNGDDSINSPSNPASPGSVVYFYGTGFGQVTPACTAGALNLYGPAYLVGVTMTVNRGGATVQYAGGAPTLPCGVGQVNMWVPFNAPPGPYTISLTAGMILKSVDGVTSSTIFVK